MKFEDLSEEVQLIAAETLREILVGHKTDHEASSKRFADCVRSAFEVLFTQKTPEPSED